MVTERLRRDAAVGQNLLDTVRALQSAIQNHAQNLIGTVEHDEPSTVEVVRAALRPIDAHREANGLPRIYFRAPPETPDLRQVVPESRHVAAPSPVAASSTLKIIFRHTHLIPVRIRIECAARQRAALRVRC